MKYSIEDGHILEVSLELWPIHFFLYNVLLFFKKKKTNGSNYKMFNFKFNSLMDCY